MKITQGGANKAPRTWMMTCENNKIHFLKIGRSTFTIFLYIDEIGISLLQIECPSPGCKVVVFKLFPELY